MPTPGQDESKEEFIDRCIPIVIEEGTAEDGSQAAAVCNSIWEESKRTKETDMYVKRDEMERRCLPSAEIRLEGTTKAPKITGYAAVFDTWTEIAGLFRESIRKGAFAKTIKENDIRALLNHDESFVLGRNKAGTARLREDNRGLAVEITPPDTTWARDLLESMRRGDINQMSFGFNVNKHEVDYEKDERVLTDVTLFDVSVVTFPAYPTTSAQVRSAFAKNRSDSDGEITPADFVLVDVGAWTGEDVAPAPIGFSELDRIVGKIREGEYLTDEELRVINSYLPSLTVPPAKHTATETEPPAKHSASDTRKGTVEDLLIRATRLMVPKPKQEV